jgi:hypothetical protein
MDETILNRKEEKIEITINESKYLMTESLAYEMV